MKEIRLLKYTWLFFLTLSITACSALRREAKFYSKHPELIPRVNKKVSIAKPVKADTLKGEIQLATAAVKTKKLYVFENERNKTTIALKPHEIEPDSFSFRVETVTKPLLIKIDTSFDYRTMVFSPPEENNLFNQLDSITNLLVTTFIIGFVVLILSKILPKIFHKKSDS